MAIAPINYATIQRTADIETFKNQQDTKPMVDQQNIQVQVDHREDVLHHQVIHPEENEQLDNHTDAREEAKGLGEAYTPIVLANGDTHKQLLARSRYLLFKSADKWTESQRQRAEVLFETYPDLKEAYSLTHSLRMIFSKNTVKDAARLSLARWYNKVDDSGFKSFNVIAATLYEHYDEVLNFFVNRATNAFAESFNAKIKAFRAALRGVTDIKFFLFRLTKLYA